MALKLRYWTRLSTAFLGRFKVLFLLSIGLGIGAFLVVRFLVPNISSSNRERIGVSGRYGTDELPNFILRQIGRGLTKVDDAGQVSADLASSWDSPDGGKTWVFKLAPNLVWQDGGKIDSQSISYSFEDVQIERPDASTIVFKLGTAFSPFPSIVAKPAFKKGLLGSGEWKVADLSLVGPYVERMVISDNNGNSKEYKFYPTEERTKLAYKLGEIDRMVDIIDPEPFTKWGTAEIIESVLDTRFVAVFFNNDDPLFGRDNKSLRQALYYAIDKAKFNKKRAVGPISPTSWAFNPQVKLYDYDPDRAKQLIAELSKEARAKLEVKLSTSSFLLPTAEAIARDWNAVGVKTTVTVITGQPEEYQAFLAIYDTPQDPDQYSTWHSTQTETNIAHYSNPRIDKLLEDGRLELDTEKRKRIYLDFQRFLIEDAPAAFLYHPSAYTIERK